jgi:general stress protein YciG
VTGSVTKCLIDSNNPLAKMPVTEGAVFVTRYFPHLLLHAKSVAIRDIFLKKDFATMNNPVKSKRGFASMDPEKQRAIARKGGQSVPAEKRSFSKNADLAATAGRKGGQSVDPAKRSFSIDHNLASEAGTKGGRASHGLRGIKAAE